jgi:myosin heavy chain 9/10/11/14
VDRSIKDLQLQIERRDKQNTSLTDDVNKARDKISSLLTTIDELQSSESANSLIAKRAERELREEKAKCLRIERELEGWKNLRVDRGSVRAGNSGHSLALPSGSDIGDTRSLRGSSAGPVAEKDRLINEDGDSVQHRQVRRVSATKGFL